MPVLSIYKASAGSGKTFKLTGEYLKLLFKNQGTFSNILAVTFTNKATAEMRERILNELHIISQGKDSAHANEIIKESLVPAKELPIMAKQILQKILHNYSRFNVSTIDSFFQRILKAFTREIGLNVGFNIELNPKPIIEKAVDSLFEDISENKSLEKWLGDYAFHKVKDGKSWDIYKDLIEFTNAGFSEVFFSFDEEHLNELLNLENFKKINANINRITKSFIEKINQSCNEFEQIVKENDLTIDDFSSKKSGVAGYFLNKVKNCNANSFALPGANVDKAANTTDCITGWVTKTSSKRDLIQNVVGNKLLKIVKDYIEFVETNSTLFFSALAVQKNLNVFAVLVEIFKRVLSYCNDNNLFLLPLASPFLAKLIEDDDAPFIYEKTGEYLNHFMIDEFQDTSQLQWKNFSPLVVNGISQNHSSLVVGDVKQSIYRWRNSDWSLLDNKLAHQFKTFKIEEQNLEFNWRSCKNVIAFNNWCFNNLSELVQHDINSELGEIFSGSDEYDDETINRIYAESTQRVPDKNSDTEGFVQLKFFDDEDYNQATLENLTTTIEQLSEKGYQPKDIAILVRRNVEGSLVARHLMELQKLYPEKEKMFRFVSNDSVFLGSSDSILLIISLLDYLNNESRINRANTLFMYYSVSYSTEKAVQVLSETDIDDAEQFNAVLPKEFILQKDKLKRMSLVDLSSYLIRSFLLNKSTSDSVSRSDLPFIHTFQDIVLNYSGQNGNDIDGFIEWWNEKGNETPVNLSEEQNAIRIITIHKSKGLEFKAVLMPFTNWKFEPRNPLLWCHSDLEPFSEFKLLPITYSSKLKSTCFSKYYAQEQLKSVVDNLNLLYVAFTRAENALFISAPAVSSKKGGKCTTVAHALLSLVEDDMQRQTLEVGDVVFDEENSVFECGEIPEVSEPISNDKQEIYEAYEFGDFQNNLRIRLQGKEISELNDEAGLSPRLKGSVYHKIFEFVQFKQDVSLAVDRVIRLGLINANERDEYIDEITVFINSESCKNWFLPEWKVYNERSILLGSGEVLRPDRIIENETEFIIIDYKFTKTPKNQYNNQVKNYMNEASSLTQKRIKGFVWYVTLNKSVEVLFDSI